MDLVLIGHRIIRIAKKIKMKPGAVDSAIIIHQKTLNPSRVLCHTKNKDVIHSQAPVFMIPALTASASLPVKGRRHCAF
jgi:hypothetical protein